MNLRSLQPLALYAANSLFVSDYLTTAGQPASEDHRMIEDLGFEVVLSGVESDAERPSPPGAGQRGVGEHEGSSRRSGERSPAAAPCETGAATAATAAAACGA